MKLTKEQVVEEFKKAEDLSEFTNFMESRKFRFTNRGVNKWVYVNKSYPWVVKIVHSSDTMPRRNSKLAKYYLFPDKRARRTLFDGDMNLFVTLMFQTRVNDVGNLLNFQKFKERLENEGILWSYSNGNDHDDHEENMGMLDGEPRIIDL
jgi:hypothetical protein